MKKYTATVTMTYRYDDIEAMSQIEAERKAGSKACDDFDGTDFPPMRIEVEEISKETKVYKIRGLTIHTRYGKKGAKRIADNILSTKR